MTPPVNASTTIKLTKAERMGLEEVRDYGSCARTWPVILKLQNRKFIKRTMGKGALGEAYKLRPAGRRALGGGTNARPQ